MTILNIVTDVTGLAGVNPTFIYVETNDTIAEVSTAGYLNQVLESGYDISSKKMALVTTKTNPGSSVSSTDIFKITVTYGIITLTEIAGGSVSFPITVSEGGTGLITLTPYALVTGGTTTTDNVQQVASLGTSGQLLQSNGPGALPSWVNAGSSVTPSALTSISDTNVTLTLGGSPSNALLNAASIAVGWTGDLAVSRGGTGLGSLTPYALVTGGTTSTGAVQQVASLGTSGQVLTSAGAGALPTWTTPAGGSGTVGSGLINQVAWYAATGTAVSGITIVNSAGLLTSAGGVPGWVAYTGTGAPVLATSPTITTPVISVINGVTTGGVSIQGTTSGGDAAPGYDGEYVTSNIPSASSISLVSGVPENLTSISLTAGDWDVFSNTYITNGADFLKYGIIGISTSSATFPEISFQAEINIPSEVATTFAINAPITRVNITTTTTVYAVIQTEFSAGSAIASGNLTARRVR